MGRCRGIGRPARGSAWIGLCAGLETRTFQGTEVTIAQRWNGRVSHSRQRHCVTSAAFCWNSASIWPTATGLKTLW